jgi:hypothetical protein
MKVELEKILSVSGKPGLFRVLSGGKSAIIAESLADGKRQPILSTQRVSALADISMFTQEEDVPLRDVLLRMKEMYKGGPALNHKAEGAELRASMKKVLPDYDEERVYDSDIRKLFQWYNLLQSKDMLEFAEAVAEAEEEEKSED